VQADWCGLMIEMVFTMMGNKQLTVIMLSWLWWSERNKWMEERRRRIDAQITYSL
jgi:hypothetical protein